MDNIFSNFNEGVAIATFGGVAYFLLAFLETKRLPKEKRPDLRDLSYWFGFIAYTFLGGLLGYVYFGGVDPSEINKMLSLHIGLTAPMILRTMANIIPKEIKPDLPKPDVTKEIDVKVPKDKMSKNIE